MHIRCGMVSDDDLVEIILETIKSSRTPNPDFRKFLDQTPVRKGKWGFHVAPLFNKPYTSLPARKIFLSEYEIKLLLKDGKIREWPHPTQQASKLAHKGRVLFHKSARRDE